MNRTLNSIYIFDHNLTWRTYHDLKLIGSENSYKRKSISILIDFVSARSDNPDIITVKRSQLGQGILALNAMRYWYQMKSKSISFSTRLDILESSRKEFGASDSGFNGRHLVSKLAKATCKLPFCTPYPLLFFANQRIARVLQRNPSKEITYVTTGGSTSMSDFLAIWASRRRVNLNVVYENWDGIFTKSVHFKKNIDVFVWGEQGRKEAIEIHGLKPSKVHAFGSPRVHHLLKAKKLARNSESHIFFAGGSLDWKTELKYLGLTAKEFPNQVVFLPHPKRYRQAEIDYELIDSFGVRMNRDLIADLLRAKELPSLNLYEDLLLKAKMTISPLSTMALESALLGKPTIVPAGNEWVSSFRESNLITNYGHLKGLLLFPNVSISYDGTTFVNNLQRLETLPVEVMTQFQEMFLSVPKDFQNYLATLFPSNKE